MNSRQLGRYLLLPILVIMTYPTAVLVFELLSADAVSVEMVLAEYLLLAASVGTAKICNKKIDEELREISLYTSAANKESG